MNVTSHGIQSRVNTTLGTSLHATGIATVTPASMAGILVGMALLVDTGGNQETVYVLSTTATTFTAFFSKTHILTSTPVHNTYIAGNVAANTTATISLSVALDLSMVGDLTAQVTDVINAFINVSDPSAIQEIRLLFDVGDGSFQKDYYYTAIEPSAFQAAVSGTTPTSSGYNNAVYDRASGNYDVQVLGSGSTPSPKDLLPSDMPVLGQLRTSTLGLGLAQWTQIQTQLQNFLPVGRAGIAGFDWSNVNAWRLQIQTIPTASVTVGLDDLYLAGGSGPDSFAGSAYDYRATFYNAATGWESSPNPVMIAGNFVSPRNQPILVTLPTTSDPQVTHVRIYRRGGGLVTGWLYVDQVALGFLSYVDTFPDSVISANNTLLNIDNGPPVTSTLRTPVNTTMGAGVIAGAEQTVTPVAIDNIHPNQVLTIGVGQNQEVVYVIDVDPIAGTFVAYFQNAHGGAETITATAQVGVPCNILQIAFDTAWAAGDPDNPHVLYYSTRFNPEAWPVENTLEVGTPSDPITGIVEIKSQLFVITQTTIYNILGANIPGASLFPVKTGVTHGMVAPYLYVIADDVMYYKSYDGIWVFNASAAQYGTQGIEWLFRDQNNGPIAPLDDAQDDTISFAFFENEVYIAYTDINGNRGRLIYHTVYQRWRNDTVPAVAQIFEEDIGALVVSDNTGMIYQDRVNNYDSGGFNSSGEIVNPIPIVMESAYLDQGKGAFQKVYQNLMLDLVTNAMELTAQLAFNNGNGPVLTLSSDVQSTLRGKVQLPVNAGLGQEAYTVSVLITGSVTDVVTFNEVAIEHAMEAKVRQAFDTYWQNYGSPGYKLAKQSVIEYNAPSGLTIQQFFGGSATASYTVTLPASTQRTAKRVRFPAYKGKIIRTVITSPDDFQLYDVSNMSVKPLCTTEGYQKATLQSEQ